MLILQRNQAQQIDINNSEKLITVLQINAHNITLAINHARSEPEIHTLKIQDTVDITPEITVCLINIKKYTVNIGINAPQHIAIHRAEVLERIKINTQKLTVFQVDAINDHANTVSQSIAANSKTEAIQHFNTQHRTAWLCKPAATELSTPQKHKPYITKKLFKKALHHRPPFNFTLNEADQARA